MVNKDEIFESLNKVILEYSTVSRVQDLCLRILCNFIDAGLLRPGRLISIKDQNLSSDMVLNLSPINTGRLILSRSRVILKLNMVDGLVSRFLSNHQNFWKSIVEYIIPEQSKHNLFEKSSMEVVKVIWYSLSILNDADPLFCNKLK